MSEKKKKKKKKKFTLTHKLLLQGSQGWIMLRVLGKILSPPSLSCQWGTRALLRGC